MNEDNEPDWDPAEMRRQSQMEQVSPTPPLTVRQIWWNIYRNRYLARQERALQMQEQFRAERERFQQQQLRERERARRQLEMESQFARERARREREEMIRSYQRANND